MILDVDVGRQRRPESVTFVDVALASDLYNSLQQFDCKWFVCLSVVFN